MNQFISMHLRSDILARDRMTDLFVRIALHTGEVFHGDGDIHGNTVNLAARLLTVTGACETTVTSESFSICAAGAVRPALPRTRVCPVCRPVISTLRDGAQTVLPA